MINIMLSIILLLACHFSFSMKRPRGTSSHSQQILPVMPADSLSQGKQPVTQSLTIKNSFLVNPDNVTKITFERVHSKDGNALGYEATLKDGSQVSCFYLLDGNYKDEIWALLWPVEGKASPYLYKIFLLLKNFIRKMYPQ